MILVGIILLLYGLCEAFLGYKLYKLSLFFTGILAGICISAIMCKGIILTVLVSIPLGILCGILSVILMRVGIFFHCFFCGVMAIMLPAMISTLAGLANLEGMITVGLNLIQTGSIGIDFTSSLPLALTIGLVAGVIGLLFAKIILIVSSAIIGGMSCGVGICLMLAQINPLVLGIVGVPVMVLGIVTQLGTNDKKKMTFAVGQPNMQNPGVALQPTSVNIGGKHFCSQCGTEYSEQISFCAKCGNKLR